MPFIEDYLPSDYDLPTNIYEWNVTEMVYYINQSDPDLLYSIDTNILLLVFPEYFISQLPRDILVAHELYQYLDIDDPLYCISNCTGSGSTNASTTDVCFEPFVTTKYEGWFECTFHAYNCQNDLSALYQAFIHSHCSILSSLCSSEWFKFVSLWITMQCNTHYVGR